MTTINRSVLLPYAIEDIYRLINEVEAYPQYMEGCVGAEILEQTETTMQARLDLAKAGINHSLTTRNLLQAPHSVKMSLVDGPFSSFSGEWQLQKLNSQACKVTLNLQFKIENRVLGLAAKALFNPMADNLVDAVVRRAKQVCS